MTEIDTDRFSILNKNLAATKLVMAGHMQVFNTRTMVLLQVLGGFMFCGRLIVRLSTQQDLLWYFMTFATQL